MGFLFFVGIVTTLIVIINNNSNLKKENDILKNIINQKKNFCPKCGFNLNTQNNYVHNYCKNTSVQVNTVYNNIPVSNVQSNYIPNNDIKVPRNEKEVKNNLILITGSILIVLAAIILLTSTWNIASNIIKTGVLVLMLGVFGGISYVADKHLKLKQTSKTFYYIALSYIPIVLFAISLFGLFGDFLSLTGEGRYLYLTLSSLLVYLIYYYNSKKRQSILLFSFSTIFQILNIIFFILIFSNSASIVLLGLFIYSIIISIMYILNKFYFSEKIHLNLCKVIFMGMSILTLNNNLFNAGDITAIILSVLLFVNMYLLVVKILNNNTLYDYLYPIGILFIFNSITAMFDQNIIKQSLILISFVCIYIYNLIKEGKINGITYIEIFVSFILYNFIWMFIASFEVTLLDYYVIFGLFTLLSFMHSYYSGKFSSFSATMFSIGSILTVLSLVLKFDLPLYIASYASFGLILISMFVKLPKLKQPTKWVGFSFLFIFEIFNTQIDLIYVLLYLICFISCFIYWLNKKEESYKVVSYICVNIFLITLTTYLSLDLIKYFIPFTTILFILIEEIFTNIKSKSSHAYLVIQTILSVIILNQDFDVVGLITLIIVSLVFVYYIIDNKKSENYLYIPFLGMIPYIFFSNFNMIYIISYLLLGIICLLIYLRKINMYIVLFYVYAFLYAICLSNSSYLQLLIFIIGSFICYLMKNNKVRDIYKGVIYFFIFQLINNIIIDLNINNMAMFTYGVYVIFGLLFIRTILNKYGNGYKVWEYIITILVNLVALNNYNSEYDGILYVIFLTIVVIVCYTLRYGPAFLVCLISILINIFLLTREFWFSIPWWLYILVIGGILIGFAVYNEVKDKDDNKKSTVEKIKQHLDL